MDSVSVFVRSFVRSDATTLTRADTPTDGHTDDDASDAGERVFIFFFVGDDDDVRVLGVSRRGTQQKRDGHARTRGWP